ncbi:3-oxoacyl-(acyl carrier protein) synthase [Caballeronia arationis]|nr:3-oxoacyl-(acyl carrier protein) synthase [Caballeronia arationis]
MTSPMLIMGMGAVTAVGLNAIQTCAAIRARISGFRTAVPLPAPWESIIGASVPVSRTLKRPSRHWLLSLAGRAARECMPDSMDENETPILLLIVPDASRSHPDLRDLSHHDVIERIQRSVRRRLDPWSTVLEGGAASGLAAISLAGELLARKGGGCCVVVGVDSMLNRGDLARLAVADRLHAEGQPQGVIPGEGAAAVLLFSRARPRLSARAMILGTGVSQEADSDTATGSRYSTGTALRAALESAATDANCPEQALSFRISDMNGERYHALESMMASARFYRSRRERLIAWYPAASVGDIGAAAGVLSLVVAARAIERGYAPGPLAVCEASSDFSLRAASILGSAPGAPSPPFRSIEVA